ncbi:thiol reductant ABC exporter subunit CydC [Pseudoalteromonas sp. GB56]
MANWRFLLALLKPHFKWAILGFVLALVALAANITLLAVSGWFLAAMASAGIAGVTMNYFTPAGVIRFLAIVRTAGGYAQRLVNHNTTFLVLKTLRIQIFTALTQLPIQKFSSVGKQISQLQEDVELLDEFYLGVLIPILLAIVGITLLAVVIGLYSTSLMWLTITALLSVGVVLPAWLSRNLKDVGANTLSAQETLNECLVEGTRGLKELQLAGATHTFWQRIENAQRALDQQQHVAHKWLAMHQGLTLFVSQLAIVCALIILVPQVHNEQVINVNLAMLVLLVLASFETVAQLPDALLKLEISLASVGRIRDLVENSNGEHRYTQSGDDTAQEVFRLQNFSFAYPAHPPLFQDVNLSVTRGEKVAIVGRSGAGKSTLLNLLTSQLIDESNSVYAFGCELSKLDKAWLYSRVGVLNQYVHTFDATIKDNLLLAQPQASDDQLWNALNMAQLGEQVEAMEQQLNTFIGYSGRQLSNGEARRLHLAQLLLRQPQVLILDEPTRGLDNENQERVFNSLLAIAHERTLIVSTHDTALLDKVDKVIWLEQGKIIAVASHRELLALYQDYRALTLIVN